MRDPFAIDQLQVAHADAALLGLLTGKDDLLAAVAIEVAGLDGFGCSGIRGHWDGVGLPLDARFVETAQPEDFARLDGGQDVFQTVAVDINRLEEHHLAAGGADQVFGPWLGLVERVLQPEDASAISLAVAEQDVLDPVAIHVAHDDRHDPTHGSQGVPLPILKLVELWRRFKPAEFRALVLAACDEIDAKAPVDLHRRGEHPLEAIDGGGQRLGLPGAFPRGLARTPVDEHRAGLALARRDDIHRSVRIEIDEDGILDGRDFADSDLRPGLAHLLALRHQVDAHDAALFPAGDNVGQPVVVDVSHTDAVGAARRNVNGVTDPTGWPVLGGTEQAQSG